ncbi:MAG: hypothetical protein AABY95_00140 [Pseudomonadota bacterium]
MVISKPPLPANALLGVYSRNGGYTDCYATDMPGVISHEQYVTAFYTTWVFKLERFILKYVVARPSTDQQAQQLAADKLDAFAAWSVEARAPNQLLMCDLYGSTRSWLMVEPINDGKATRLYFGSAVVPKEKTKKNWIPAYAGMTTKTQMPFMFHALLGFHQLYSRILLSAAARKLSNPSP